MYHSRMVRPVPAVLLAGYVLLFAACAIHPYDRAVWWAENTPIVLIAAVLVLTYRQARLSDLSYILMSVLLYLHTIGGHYTFERVPFDFVNRLFGWERNQYDRFAHFSVGFYAYAIAELLLVQKLVRSKAVLLLFPVFAIFTVAAAYEIIEWLYAAAADPNAGAAFLGSQGDIWDAQKDMLADGCGAIVATALFWVLRRKEMRPV
jgi:putative membrane protein